MENRFVSSFKSDEKGSIMIEASIIFPFVIILIFILISISILIHDVYVCELTLAVIDEEDFDLNVKDFLNQRLIALEIDDKDIKEDNYKMEIDLPLVATKEFNNQKIDFREDGLNNIMIIELSGDVFDDLAIPNIVKDKYDSILKSILQGLEKH